MRTRITVLFMMIALCLPSAATAFDSGSSGADGAFNPQSSVEVVLPEDGILNYTTVNVPEGVTVTFKKNTGNTPVYMLATGDVTIAGKIDVSGKAGVAMTPGEGGPGGFVGGLGGSPGQCGGAGFGPGGGKPGVQINPNYCATGGGGSYGSLGQNGWRPYNGTAYSIAGSRGNVYGNEELVPLIGGSGGSGGCTVTGYYAGAGGGGGGAILIASSGKIHISGSIHAKGGKGADSSRRPDGNKYNSGSGGGGSGGAIKLMASEISGAGSVSAAFGEEGGVWHYSYYTVTSGDGGSGRLRFEAGHNTFSAVTNPANYSFSRTQSPVFPANAPNLKIVSIGGKNVPDLATGSLRSPDILLKRSATGTVDVVLEASNIPTGTDVVLEARPELGAIQTTTTALSGTDEASSATTALSLNMERISVITATATFTYQTAANGMPLYVEGEKVEKVRVSASLGGSSVVTYITESGREVAATL